MHPVGSTAPLVPPAHRAVSEIIRNYLKPSGAAAAPIGRSERVVDQRPTDSVSLERLRRRDHDAFTQLVQDHQRLVLGLAQSMGFKGADLDETATEVFSEVFLSLPRFKGESSVRTWIYRIAVRTIGRFRRRRSISAAQRLDLESPDTLQLAPDAMAESDEVRTQLWNAVANLDDRAAAVVELYYRQEWSLPEIADAMQFPVGTVKTILFRAREELRKALGSTPIQR